MSQDIGEFFKKQKAEDSSPAFFFGWQTDLGQFLFLSCASVVALFARRCKISGYNAERYDGKTDNCLYGFTHGLCARTMPYRVDVYRGGIDPNDNKCPE